MGKWANKKGSASIAEYAITFLLVVGAGMAISTYVQRSLQANIRNAGQYVIASASSACGASCMNATNLNGQTRIQDQYEPYYTKTSTGIVSNVANQKALVASSDKAGVFIAKANVNNKVNAVNNQAAPKDAN